MPFARKASVVVLAFLVMAGVAGCGDDGGKAPARASTTPAATTPAVTTPAANLIHQRDVQGVPLGTPEKKILSRFGEPTGRPSNSAQSCLVYPTDAGPDTWLRFCFVDGKLANLASLIGRQNALTLNPPLPKGPGKLRHPTVSPPRK